MGEDSVPDDGPRDADRSRSGGDETAHERGDVTPEGAENGAGIDTTTNGTEESGQQPVEADETDCPECGNGLPADARFCPHCSTAIDESGGAVDLSELEGDVIEEPAELLVEDDAGNRTASGPVRALSGLAVAVPLAPLVLFLVGSVVSLSVWTAGLVFLSGWLVPAAVLARSRVPAEAFGRSLFLVGVCTLLVPLAVRGRESGLVGSGALSFEGVAGLSLLIAVLAIGLGLYVTNQAGKRVSGERRAFEDLREE
ncbi:MAG: zinc-ribbon domain-containing protein [Haloarculaceae archaeon]